MLVSTEKIVNEIPNIPVDDRLVLIDSLLKSVNLPAREGIDRAWSKEVERRRRALDDGTATLIPGEANVGRQFCQDELVTFPENPEQNDQKIRQQREVIFR